MEIQIDPKYRVHVPSRRTPKLRPPRCAKHPGVHMVLAGTNSMWNTVRYLCPLCNAAGHPPIEVATGSISTYYPERGYGFINGGGPRIFFHISEWSAKSAPSVGVRVTCRVEQNGHGLLGRGVCPC